MVIIKRYFGRLRKPLGWRRALGTLRRVVLPALCAAAALWGTRTYVLTQYRVGTDRPELHLLQGDRLLVYRLAYLHAAPREGDLVVFTRTEAGVAPQVGRVVAPVATAGASNKKGQAERAPRIASQGDTLDGGKVLGRVWCISYSVDAAQPPIRRLRAGRYFKALAAE